MVTCPVCKKKFEEWKIKAHMSLSRQYCLEHKKFWNEHYKEGGISWEGDGSEALSTYTTKVHKWLFANYGVPKDCENPECIFENRKVIWTLLKEHKLQKNRENFIRLCRPCAYRYWSGKDINFEDIDKN